MAQNSGFTKSFSRDARSTMMHGAELLGHRAGRGKGKNPRGGAKKCLNQIFPAKERTNISLVSAWGWSGHPGGILLQSIL